MTPPSSEPAPDFASPVASALRRFLEFKRAAGYHYREEAGALCALDRFLSRHLAPEEPIISRDVVRAWVARRGQESETTRAHRLTLIRQVCRFLVLEEPRTAVPGPRFLGVCRRPFVPRVLTREEGRRFLQACGSLGQRCSPIRPTVLGTLLVLLYLTGLRAGEALRLADIDVDVDTGVLRVRDTKFGKSRLVPVAVDVAARLRACRVVVERHFGRRPPDRPFFPAPGGGRYAISTLQTAFRQVCLAAGLPRWSGGRALRLHDLRHSFATLRLLRWYEQDADLTARLPALAAYLGHVGLSSSQRYLQLTPDLASELTRRHAARFGALIAEGRPS